MTTELIKEVVTKYLYGNSSISSNLVSDTLIRPDSATSTVAINAADFMTQSGGRFAFPSQFKVVQKFFAEDTTLTAGSYTIDQMLTTLGLGATAANANIDQKEYASGPDYLERVLIFNNTGFEIENNSALRFVVDANGTRHIKNLKVIPQTDNFDFIGGDSITGSLNNAIQPFLDPSGALHDPALSVGHKVYLTFTGNIAADTDYTYQEYLDDVSYIGGQRGLAEQALQLGPSLAVALNDLWDDGITKFLDSAQRPILYGTNGTDVLSEANIADVYNTGSTLTGIGTAFISNLLSYRSNGVVLIGGKGNDRLFGGDHGDSLLGGDANDVLNGGKGDDTLEGGKGSDTYAFLTSGDGMDTVSDDGKGDHLYFGVDLFHGEAVKTGSNTYTLDGYNLTKSGSTMTVSKGSDAITLTNWQEGDYGITLQQNQNQPNAGPGHIIAGDIEANYSTWRLFPSTEAGGRAAGVWVAETLVLAQNGYSTPLVVDLNGNGPELSTVYDYTWRFDMDNDGFAEYTGWVKPSDAFLVVDKNSNGVIDNQGEMFGADTSGATAWSKLGNYDSNLDGKVTQADANWGELRLWRDLNGNGKTDSGELFTPQSQGVYGFSLTHDGYSLYDDTTGYNDIEGRADWLNASGAASGKFYDVRFQIDQQDTEYVGADTTQPIAYGADTLAYPIMRGVGTIKPMQLAVSENPTLKDTLDRFLSVDVSQHPGDAAPLAMQTMFAWANVDYHPQGSKGTNPMTLKLLDALYGVLQEEPGAVSNPVAWDGPVHDLSGAEQILFNIDWDYTAGGIYASLLALGPYANLFQDAYYDYQQGVMIINGPAENILTAAQAVAPTDTIQASSFWSDILAILTHQYGELTVGGGYTDNAGIKSAVASAAGSGVTLFDFSNTLYAHDGYSISSLNTQPAHLIGDDGANTLIGHSDSDLLQGGGGDDYLKGGTMQGGDGADIFALGGNLVTDFEDGKDLLDMREGGYTNIVAANPGTYDLQVVYDPATNLTNLNNHSGSTVISLIGDFTGKLNAADLYFGEPSPHTDGADMIVGDGDTNVLQGGKGNDLLEGGQGADVYVFNPGDGTDVIEDYSGTDTIRFGAGVLPSDVSLLRFGSDNLLRYSATDAIYVKGGNVENLMFDSDGSGLVPVASIENAALAAKTTPGNDYINTEPQSSLFVDDTLDGGAGVNTLTGGTGNDTYVVSADQGINVIFDGYGSADTVRFDDIASSDAHFSRCNLDLIVDITAGGIKEEAIISNFFKNSTYVIEQFVFSDTTLTNSQVTTLAAATADDQLINGTNAANTLTGGLGNDTLQGGNGADTYIYNAGDGHDYINDLASGGTQDTLILGSGLTPANLLFTRSLQYNAIPSGSQQTDTISLNFLGYDGSIMLEGQLGGKGISQLQFGDGTVWTRAQLLDAYIASALTSGDDFFTAPTNYTQDIHGLAGDDYLNAAGNTVTLSIYGDDGNDTIVGYSAGAKSYYGGNGLDYLVGSNGAEYFSGGNDMDVILGGHGNDTIAGDAGSDYLDGGYENDSISGGDGDDTIIGGPGADTIDGGAGSDFASYESSNAAVNVSLATGTGSGGDAQGDVLANVENIIGSPYADTLTGNAGDNIIFGNGGDDSISGGDGNDLLQGSDGNDTLQGENGNDTLIGGLGPDSLNGGAGNDVLYSGGSYASSTGDTLTGGSGNDVFRFTSYDDSHTNNAAIITDFVRGQDKIDLSSLPAIYGLDALTVSLSGGNTLIQFDPIHNSFGFLLTGDFTQGSNALTASDFIFHAPAITGTSGADSLTGTAADDTIYGLAGNDLLLGGDGNDTLSGDAGADTLSGQNGDDVMYGGDDNDVLYGTAGADTLYGDAGNDSLYGGTENDSLSGGTGDDTLSGDDGSDVLHGDDGNDSLSGGYGNDTVYGDAGNDFIGGWWGDDSLSGGDGNDTINGGPGADTIDGGAGIDTLTYASAGGGVNVSLATGTGTGSEAQGDVISTIEIVIGSSYQDTLTGGANADKLQGGAGADLLLGGNGDDTLTGDAGADTISGQNGNDSLSGGDNNDVLYGTAGADTLSGDAGNDSLYGGTENDSLLGGTGDDTLSGDDGDDVLHGNDGNDSLGGGNGNDTVYGDAGNDSIGGWWGDDSLAGGNGNDTINGGPGNDTLIGGLGADSLISGAGSDLFVFLTLTDSTAANRDVITDFAKGADKIDFSGIAAIAGMSDLTVSLSGGNTHLVHGSFDLELLGDFTQGANQLAASDFVF